MDQIERNEDGTYTVRILEAYQDPEEAFPGKKDTVYERMRGEEPDEITLRRIYVHDLLACPAEGDGDKQYAALTSRLGGVPMSTVQRMSLADFAACTRALIALRELVPKTGGSASAS